MRLFSILLALPMSWAVYQAAAILFGSRRVAASSAILLNITLMAAVGTMIVTPDAPALVASSLLLFALAKVLQAGRGVWWLAVGAAAGCALLSKYTALFFGPAILIWLVAVPKLRHWLISPWLYLGGLVALLLFTPVILWNAGHHWVSFIKQMGRARIEDFRPVYIAEARFRRRLRSRRRWCGCSARWGFTRCSACAPARCRRARSSMRCSGSSSPISSGIRCMPASRPTGLGRSIRRLRSPPPSPPIWSNGSHAGNAGRFQPALGGAGRRPDVRAPGRAG